MSLIQVLRKSCVSLAAYTLLSLQLALSPSRAEENIFWKVVVRDSAGKLYLQRSAFSNDGRGVSEVWIKEVTGDLEYKVQYDCEANRLRYLQYNPSDPDRLWGEWEAVPDSVQAIKLKESACAPES